MNEEKIDFNKLFILFVIFALAVCLFLLFINIFYASDYDDDYYDYYGEMPIRIYPHFIDDYNIGKDEERFRVEYYWEGTLAYSSGNVSYNWLLENGYIVDGYSNNDTNFHKQKVIELGLLPYFSYTWKLLCFC